MAAKILVLDDEAIIALDIAAQLEDEGHVVIGPFFDLGPAIEAAQHGRPNAAILDFNLGNGATSQSLAERLAQNGVPFCFLSGYSATDVIASAGFPDARVVSKPVSPSVLPSIVDALLETADTNGG